jgi:broad specificity phosphatase PhoE
MHLYLARHAQQAAGYDPPLTTQGLAQADDLAAWAASAARPDRVVSSSLRRCQQTAGPVSAAVGIEYQCDHRLRELGTCRPDGSAFESADVPRYGSFPVWEHPERPTADGLESWVQLRQRVEMFLASLLASISADQRCLAITHSGVIHAVFEVLCGLPPGGGVHTGMAHTGVTHWEHDPNAVGGRGWRLHNHNLVPAQNY